jgi:polyisoprenoid-binding protein YceI
LNLLKNLTGLLTIAGKTKEVKLTVDIDVKNAQRFLVTGNVPLKMLDFGVEPPTALMGTITRHGWKAVT